MLLIKIFICLSFGLVFGANPDWGRKPYIVTGILYLDYGNIAEPFQAWIDNSTKGTERSRIDYYSGYNTIIYDNGLGYKIIPDTRPDGKMRCFNATGRVEFQNLLPNITSYQMVDDKLSCEHKGTLVNCTHYRSSIKYFDRLNIYDMYVGDNDVPLHYNFTGYNFMMDTHYDHYIFIYTDYQEGYISQSIFEISPTEECPDFPDPGISHFEMDPMREFSMGNEDYEEQDKETSLEFEKFKMKYSKKYNTDVEHETRKSVFRQARRYIHSKNRQNLSYKLEINHLSDQNEKELKWKNGYRYTGVGESHRVRSNELIGLSNMPESVNWTASGAVNLPKDQGTCGGGWSFGTTGTLEGSYFLKHNKLLLLSEQCLLDCTWDQGNRACDGGEGERAAEWLMLPGICEGLSISYLVVDPLNVGYFNADSFCLWPGAGQQDCVKVRNYTVLPLGDLDMLRQMSANVGPIQVSIDAGQPSFQFYSSGIYYEENCANSPQKLDHSVLLVGYGTENGEDYWLIRNSWSAFWGDHGSMKISTRNNNCGVATNAMFFTIA